jgi:putative hydrolases of HD superfamily
LIENLIERFFKAATMERWNDHIRPVELTELDKQAHKMIIAYVLAKIEEDSRGQESINWINLIEGFLFDFLYRLVLTDLKPGVFHRMMDEKREELNQHVLKELKTDLDGLNDHTFEDKFKNYLSSREATLERKILRAAHYLATDWEFKIIYNTTPFIYGIEKTRENIENQIEDHYDLIGVQKIMLQKKSFGFIDLCGQLRFQKRWAHSPRIPETSVLGHMLIVAATSYLCTLELGVKPCDKRLYNNFFAGLFHDLPEVLTKDIISPVKQSVEGLDDIIKEYEEYQMKRELLPLLPKTWHHEMQYFTGDEFQNKIKDNERVKFVSFADLNKKYNKNEYLPVDGELLKACDRLAAFAETKISFRHGVTSKDMEEAEKSMMDEWKSKKVSGIDFGQIFRNLEKLIDE